MLKDEDKNLESKYHLKTSMQRNKENSKILWLAIIKKELECPKNEKSLKVPEEGETTPAGYKEVPYHNIFDKFTQDKLLKKTEMSHKHMRLIHKSWN